METTRPVLSASSRDGRTEDKKAAGTLASRFAKAFQAPSIQVTSSDDGDKPSLVQPTYSNLPSVLSSLKKMQLLRQRTLVNKGNVTSSCPLRKFDPAEVEREMDRILESALNGVEYEPSRAALLTKKLSDAIRGAVKAMKFPRYKLIVTVLVSSRSEQCMVAGSRCLWNTASDSSATSRYVTDQLLAVASVYAMLKE